MPKHRYLIPPGIADRDLPPEVRAGLRLCVKIATRIARERNRKEEQRRELPPETD